MQRSIKKISLLDGEIKKNFLIGKISYVWPETFNEQQELYQNIQENLSKIPYNSQINHIYLKFSAYASAIADGTSLRIGLADGELSDTKTNKRDLYNTNIDSLSVKGIDNKHSIIGNNHWKDGEPFVNFKIPSIINDNICYISKPYSTYIPYVSIGLVGLGHSCIKNLYGILYPDLSLDNRGIFFEFKDNNMSHTEYWLGYISLEIDYTIYEDIALKYQINVIEDQTVTENQIDPTDIGEIILSEDKNPISTTYDQDTKINVILKNDDYKFSHWTISVDTPGGVGLKQKNNMDTSFFLVTSPDLVKELSTKNNEVTITANFIQKESTLIILDYTCNISLEKAINFYTDDTYSEKITFLPTSIMTGQTLILYYKAQTGYSITNISCPISDNYIEWTENKCIINFPLGMMSTIAELQFTVEVDPYLIYTNKKRKFSKPIQGQAFIQKANEQYKSTQPLYIIFQKGRGKL